MLTTPNRGYPKPENTDPFAQGFDAIADLADALDTDLHRPRCHAFLPAAVSLPNSTVTVLSLTGEVYDTHGMHDTVTNPSRITIPAGQGGLYLVTLAVDHAYIGGNQVQGRLHKNGVATFLDVGPGNGSGSIRRLSAMLPLVPGDYLELAAYQAAGSAQNLNAGQYNTFLQVVRVA